MGVVAGWQSAAAPPAAVGENPAFGARKPSAQRIRDSPLPLPRLSARMGLGARHRTVRNLRLVRSAALILSVALLPWQAVWATLSPRPACCRLSVEAGQCRRQCPTKASLESEAKTAGPSMACHRSSGARSTEAKCRIKSRCSNDHAKPAWNSEPPCLPEFAEQLPLPARLSLQATPLTAEWSARALAPPAPPPHPAQAG